MDKCKINIYLKLFLSLFSVTGKFPFSLKSRIYNSMNASLCRVIHDVSRNTVSW